MKNATINLIILGSVLGAVSFFSVDAFIITLLLAACFVYIWLRFPAGDERRFILSVFSWGIAARLLLIILYYYFFLLPGNTDIIAPDGECYQARGWYISRFLTGGDMYIIPSSEQIFRDYRDMVSFYAEEIPDWRLYQVGVFSYAIAFLYSVFDYVPQLIKFINAVFSVASAIVIYELAKSLFGKKAARISMIIIAFLPSIFVFSLTSARDPMVILLLCLSIYSLTKFYLGYSLLHLAVVFFCAGLVYFIRISVFAPLMLVLAIALFISLRFRFRWKISFLVLCGLLVFSSGYRQKALSSLDLATLTNPHIGYINTPGNNYKILPDGYYSGSKDIRKIPPLDLAVAFLKGLFHSLFEPFPWKLKTKGELFGAVQALAWVMFFPFALIGISFGLKHKLKESHVAFICVVVFSALLAIGEGNVGTVFRHRDMLMPFFIIFGVAGIFIFFDDKELSEIAKNRFPAAK
ncbi:hypothetical protein EPN16_00885 [bacterium]|nr:MAG: hypothetical protein EPN16_00885 [bacterium]